MPHSTELKSTEAMLPEPVVDEPPVRPGYVRGFDAVRGGVVETKIDNPLEQAIMGVADLDDAIAELMSLTSWLAPQLQKRIATGVYTGAELGAMTVMSLLSRLPEASYHPVDRAIAVEKRHSHVVLDVFLEVLEERLASATTAGGTPGTGAYL